MKRVSTFLLVLSILFLISCKFDETPVGVYTGTFTAKNLPDTAGTGTVTISESSPGLYNITFSSAGNPDLVGSNIALPRSEWSHSNNAFEGGGNNPFDIYVREYDEYNHIPWALDLHYYTYIAMVSTTVDFTGRRQ